MENEGFQKCYKCDIWKTFEEFSRNKRKSHGFETTCKICLSKDGKESNMLGKPARVKHTIVDGKEGKKCKICDTWKSFENCNFKVKGEYKDGKVQYDSYCKHCINNKEHGKRKIKAAEKLLVEQQDPNYGKKKCKKCDIWKEPREFRKNIRGKYEVGVTCRMCICKYPELAGKLVRAEHSVINGKEGKKCKVCETWKSFEENNYKIVGKYKDESIQYHTYCRSCFNEKERARHNNKPKDESEERKLEIKQNIENGYKKIEKPIITVDGINGQNCNKCNIWKPLGKFHKDCIKYRDGRDKYRGKCRACQRLNENFRLRENLRGRIYGALKGETKSDNTIKLLGCTVDNLWIHLESKFQENMTRGNYGEWHVDHIKPCSIFDLTDPREQRRCFNYRNLQPLWGSENISKNDKYIWNVVLEIALYNIK
jgi:hypothetical protein